MNIVCTDLCKCAFSEQYECKNVESSNGGHAFGAEGVDDDGQSLSSVFTINNTFLIKFRLDSFIFYLNFSVNNTLLIVLKYQ